MKIIYTGAYMIFDAQNLGRTSKAIMHFHVVEHHFLVPGAAKGVGLAHTQEALYLQASIKQKSVKLV